MSRRKWNRIVVIALSVGALFAASSLHAADADATVVVEESDPNTGACKITVEPAANAQCTTGAQDICVGNDAKLDFSIRPDNLEFYIVPDPFRNPLFVRGIGNGQCKARSTNGELRCKVKTPKGVEEPDAAGYKFWVFAEGCAQPLDPRIYINR